MSQEKSGKSRRRFLADILFLSGGVTAAALLAKSGFGTEAPPSPAAPPPSPPPPPAAPVEEYPRTKGEVSMPEGEMTLPEAHCVDDSSVGTLPESPPQVEGRAVMPKSQRPIPAGGMIAPNY